MASSMLVMSVTRLSSGVCVACVDEGDCWIRPTREERSGWRQLELSDLRDTAGKVVVRVGNIVDWAIGRSIPRDMHKEDRAVPGDRPELLRTLSPEELLSRCEHLAKAMPLRDFLASDDHSLGLFKPNAVHMILFDSRGKGGVTARIIFTCAGHTEENLSVTDLCWRALGRQLLQDVRSPTPPVLWLSAEELRRRTGLSIHYLAVGKGQAWPEGPPHPLTGQFWPFVTTVFTAPEMTVEVDYANL